MFCWGNLLGQAPADSTSATGIITIAEAPPRFPGGPAEFSRFLSPLLKYPRDARRKRIEGKVFVSFIVERDGSVKPETVGIEKGLYPSLDEEAVRVVKLTPDWIPGTQRGRSVRCKTVVPIQFVLTD